ncbi:MAG: ADOP family duplicated permease [Vicinamibacterales bacterium]
MELARWSRLAWMRLRALVRAGALDDELDEELRFHLDHLVETNIARGLSPAAARREALLAMDGIERRKEECRDTRGVRLVHDVVQDVRYAARTLRRAPAFTTASILTLALGIGATAAMFTVVNGVLLRPLPFPEPDRLFLVALSPKSFLMPQPGMADATYVQFKERDRVFQHLAAFSSYKGNLVGAGEPVVLNAARVTTEFFDALAVQPAMGRTFQATDGGTGRGHTVVLSDRLWRSRFGSDPAIVGKDVTLNAVRHTAIGVMPAGFDFPGAIDAWTPHVVTIDPGRSLLVPVLGRLKPEISVDQAVAGFETVVASLPDGIPEDRAAWDVGLLPLKELLVGDVRRPLRLFAGAVLLVLLVACANVANLLLARASGRDREIAVRAAIGAGRRRLVRQLITESVLLSAIGAAFGVLLARWTVPGLLALAPPGRIPRTDMIRIDGATLAFAAGVALITGVLFGLAPALRLTRDRLPMTALPGNRTTGGHERYRAALVVAEIALALVLLTGAGLLAKSFLRLRAVDNGFRVDNVVRMSLELPQSAYSTPERVHAFHDTMLARLSTLPHVVAAGVVNWLPLGRMHLNGDFRIDGAGQDPGFNVDKTAVSPGYFRAMGIRLQRGREFDEHDTQTSPGVAVVSRSVARAVDPSENALGRRISVWGRDNARQWLTIVGVVDDVKQLGPSQKSHAAVYQPYLQVGQLSFLRDMTYVVRTASDPLAAVPALRNVLRSVDQNQPASIGLMRDTLEAATAEPAFYARLLGIFALLAVILALVGTYGVIAYSVVQRSHEIGLRMALGARSSRVFWMVIRRTVMLGAAGVILGTAAAWGVTRSLRAFLFEITPTDPATFAAVALAIFATAVLAGAMPARRATRVDPLVALRHE